MRLVLAIFKNQRKVIRDFMIPYNLLGYESCPALPLDTKTESQRDCAYMSGFLFLQQFLVLVPETPLPKS